MFIVLPASNLPSTSHVKTLTGQLAWTIFHSNSALIGLNYEPPSLWTILCAKSATIGPNCELSHNMRQLRNSMQKSTNRRILEGLDNTENLPNMVWAMIYKQFAKIGQVGYMLKPEFLFDNWQPSKPVIMSPALFK